MSNLEVIEDLPCTKEKLTIFSRAHYSYINQIFGDQTVRAIIQEVMKHPGKLIFEPSGPGFENSFHHMFKKTKAKSSIVCSAMKRYQDITVDINDNLCQSYSLMSYLNIPFDTTESSDATVEQKHSKHMSMIAMYREILKNKDFIKAFSNEIVFEGNNELWQDTIDEEFNIIEHYKSGSKILKVIGKVIDIWEKYGWMYFIGKGECIKTATAATAKVKATVKNKTKKKRRRSI